jgi:hypothetical protein
VVDVVGARPLIEPAAFFPVVGRRMGHALAEGVAVSEIVAALAEADVWTVLEVT